MGKALYRKYRPCSLDAVVGQSQVTELLAKSLASGKISHAYLFIGPRGCGKTSVARIFAHAINNFDYQIEDDYVDIIEIDGASNRGIDNIRELREKVAIAPTKGKYKVYIIDEVHMLTKEAFNALLKTLEEPPAHAIFIMATTDAYKVPVTITSRAQVYTFKLADADTMANFLKSVCEQEGIKINPDALDLVVKRGGGSFRDSLSLLDQISTLSTDTITRELIASALGLPEDDQINELLAAYSAQSVVKITTLLKDLLSSGIKPETIAEELIGSIIANPDPTFFPLLAALPDVKSPFPEAKLLLALAAQQSFANIATSPKSVSSRVPESEFDWNTYLDQIRSLSDAIYSQLLKTSHTFSDNTLDIYPERRIVYTILNRDNNKRILTSIYSNIKIILHENSDGIQKDPLVSKISGIMGGAEEVKQNGGSPF